MINQIFILLLLFLQVENSNVDSDPDMSESVLPLMEDSDIEEDKDENINGFFAPEEIIENENADSDTVQIDLEAVIKQEAAEKNKSALNMLKNNKIPEALALLQDAYSLDSQNPEIVNNLGYAFYLLGNIEDAQKYYKESLTLDPGRVVAIVNLADLLYKNSEESPDAGKMAAELLLKARELEGNSPRIILRQARVAALRLDFSEGERFYNEYLEKRKPTDVLKIEIGDFYRDFGELDEALKWYKTIKGNNYKKKAEDRIWNIEVLNQSVSLGWSDPDVPQKAKDLVKKAGKLFNSHNYSDAEKLYQQALLLGPSYVEGLMGYGDLLFRNGKREDAELYFLRALAIKQDYPEVYVRLSKLYLTDSDNREKNISTAVIFLQRALKLRPEWSELELELAVALRLKGDVLDALLHVKKYLLLQKDNSTKRAAALRLKSSLEMLLSPLELAKLSSGEDELFSAKEKMSPEVVIIIQKAMTHLKNGSLNEAMVTLESVKGDDLNSSIINLKARIMLGAGKTVKALNLLKESLALKEEQPEVHEQIAITLLSLNKKRLAKLHFKRAYELGEPDAEFQLIKIDYKKQSPSILYPVFDLRQIATLIDLKNRLKNFINNNPQSLYISDAERYYKILQKRILNVWYLIFSIGFIIIILSVVITKKVYGGYGLAYLIKRFPESGIEVQRILSAVRHEVLKHNTMMLTGLVEALESGDDASELASYVAKRIALDKSGGVSSRLRHYVLMLNRIGDANKIRLNLKRKDPALAPLIEGMNIAAKNSDDLVRIKKLGKRRQRKVLQNIKRASILLNVEGYEAVRELLDNLRVLKIDKKRLKNIFKRCVTEPSFAGLNVTLSELIFEKDIKEIMLALPAAVFEDIITNLIRNAVQSSQIYNETDFEISIGLEINLEIDGITGIERVLISVKDKSKRELTAQMLKGRYIEEGLGLTADLITMYDGSIDVVKLELPFEKAVVVKLPMAR
ncbi:MAG: tetratricopeptide repeat protein [Deltaproteobacteria bacterium]|nr:tetratricopeptide repeat protein [Deltaproteobacteria bacterium]